MALPKLRFKKATEPKPDIEKALSESALQSEGIVVTGANRPSTAEAIADSTISRDKVQSFIDNNTHDEEGPGLGNEPDEPSGRDRRQDPFTAGSGDITSIFGEGTSTKDQLAAALGIDPSKVTGDGTAAGRDAGGGETSVPGGAGGPRGSDGGPTGLFGLGYGRTTHAGTGFAEVDSGADHSAVGKGGIMQTVGYSGVAPVGYDEEEGVKSGKGMQDLAKEYPNAPSVSPDKLGGGLGDAMRQALDEQDRQSTRQSSDGVVHVEKLSTGTIIVTNSENGTTTRLNPDGSSVTTDTASGKVIDKSNPNSASQPIDDVPPMPPEYQAFYNALKGDPADRKPYTGSGDVDPDENPTAPTLGDVGEPVDMKLRLLVDPPDPDSGIAGPRTGTPTMSDFGGLPGDVDPTEDTFIPGATGPEDDPLASLDNPGLKPSAQSSSSDEEEVDEDEETD